MFLLLAAVLRDEQLRRIKVQFFVERQPFDQSDIRIGGSIAAQADFLNEPVKHGSRDFPIGVHESVCEAGFHLYPHLHAEFEFLVIRRGSGILCVDGVSHRLGEGDGAFVNAQSIHLGLPDSREPVSFYAIVFSPRIFGAEFNDAVVDKYVSPVLRRSLRLPAVYTECVPWQEEALQTAEELRVLGLGGDGSELEVKSRLFHLWALLCGHGERTQPVSYTPLDVYKRQPPFLCRVEYILPSTGGKCKRNGDEFAHGKQTFFGERMT